MKKTILMIVAALFVLIAVNAQTRKVTPRIRKSGNPAQVIKGKTVPIRKDRLIKERFIVIIRHPEEVHGMILRKRKKPNCLYSQQNIDTTRR